MANVALRVHLTAMALEEADGRPAALKVNSFCGVDFDDVEVAPAGETEVAELISGEQTGEDVAVEAMRGARGVSATASVEVLATLVGSLHTMVGRARGTHTISIGRWDKLRADGRPEASGKA